MSTPLARNEAGTTRWGPAEAVARAAHSAAAIDSTEAPAIMAGSAVTGKVVRNSSVPGRPGGDLRGDDHGRTAHGREDQRSQVPIGGRGAHGPFVALSTPRGEARRLGSPYDAHGRRPRNLDPWMTTTARLAAS